MELEICKDYKSGMSMADITKKYHKKGKTIRAILAKNEVDAINTQHRFLYFNAEDIIYRYTIGNQSSEKIGEIYNVSDRTIVNILGFNNITIKKHGQRTWRDPYFFDQIDSAEKAYILGFLYADGSVVNNSISATQVVSRRDVLDKIAIILHCPVHQYQREGQNDTVQFSVAEPRWVKVFAQYGIVPNKSHCSAFNATTIPQEFKRDFIRGLFDGDGLAYINKKQLIIGFCSAIEENVFSFFEISGFPVLTTWNSGIYFQTIKSKNFKEFFNWLYADATIYSEKKYLVIKNYLDNSELTKGTKKPLAT